jgi:hypothetical protein
MHDLTATLFHVVCGCVQRIRVPDLIRITPFLSAAAREIPESASSSREMDGQSKSRSSSI